MDRRREEAPGRRSVRAAVYAAGGEEPLERGEHQARRGVDRAWVDDAAWRRCVRAKDEEEHGPVLLREPAAGIQRRTRGALQEEQEGLGVLPGAATVEATHGHLVRRQRRKN